MALALITIQVMVAITVNVSPVKAQAIITVPGDYLSISAAIGNATDGDTISVQSGVYYENIVIDKQISLIGQGAVIVGTGGLMKGLVSVVNITADHVSLSGFTIQSKPYTNTNLAASGIFVNADNCSLKNLNINGTFYGIFSSHTSNSVFFNNSITYAVKDGLRICGGDHNTFSRNLITYNGGSGLALDGYFDMVVENIFVGNVLRGIGLGARYSVVWGNNFTVNVGQGIYLGGIYNVISSNQIAENKAGMYITANFAAPNNNTIYNNNFVNNEFQVQIDAASQYNNQTWSRAARGNYWSNYNGADANEDGVGDTPFNLYLNNVDPYPLMNQSISTDNAPTLPTSSSTANMTSQWTFDEIEPNGATPDRSGNNPIIVETVSGTIVSPKLVAGIEGNALQFNGSDYAYFGSSPALDIKNEFTIDVWVKVQEFKNIEYNAIVEECRRTPDTYPTRVFGLAFNGVPPSNDGALALGTIRGFFLDKQGVFNEIDTAQTVLQPDQWTHIIFTRSLTTGMHIYVNGVEQAVKVASGSQNPVSAVAAGSEFYIGHDSISILDNLKISTIAIEQPQQTTTQPTATLAPTAQPTEPTTFLSQWWFWTTIACVAAAVLISGLLLSKRNNKPT